MRTSRMPSGVAVLACAAGLALAVTSCGTATETSSASTPTVAEAPPTVADAPPTVTDAPPAVSGCPTAPPEAGGTPDWTLPGATGSVAVTGSTDTAAPLVDVTAPFSVTDTQVHTLQAGTGPVVGDTATVSVCYMGVNGRDGTVFDSSYERGAPVEFPLEGVIPGFQKAIAGQTVGSTVAVAMTSADGYPDGQPAAGIQPGDSLIFALEILDATG